MTTILDDIVAMKREELERQKSEVPLDVLEERIAAQPRPLNLSGALLGDRVRLIAEVKKASPSRGLLSPNFDPVQLATTYTENGGAAISVLSDPRFQGTLEHLEAVKQAVLPQGIPVLRKDFVFDPYQVYEARAYGADAILLIVAILTPEKFVELMALSRRFWMQCVVEVHTREELETALESKAEIIGINNRDLRTFHTDLSVTREIAGLMPRGKVVVSESGISTREDMLLLRQLGVHAALVGEALVTAPDVGAKVKELV
ncbi:MAG: indole-3-glycerol phosphate synthase TrpC [Dehalococcoidia bacterium]|nr:indole-3-glycerol phosphate synthase TrpC [Dehalococcoidia bacterium]